MAGTTHAIAAPDVLEMWRRLLYGRHHPFRLSSAPVGESRSFAGPAFTRGPRRRTVQGGRSIVRVVVPPELGKLPPRDPSGDNGGQCAPGGGHQPPTPVGGGCDAATLREKPWYDGIDPFGHYDDPDIGGGDADADDGATPGGGWPNDAGDTPTIARADALPGVMVGRLLRALAPGDDPPETAALRRLHAVAVAVAFLMDMPWRRVQGMRVGAASAAAPEPADVRCVMYDPEAHLIHHPWLFRPGRVLARGHIAVAGVHEPVAATLSIRPPAPVCGLLDALVADLRSRGARPEVGLFQIETAWGWRPLDVRDIAHAFDAWSRRPDTTASMRPGDVQRCAEAIGLLPNAPVPPHVRLLISGVEDRFEDAQSYLSVQCAVADVNASEI